MTDSGLVRIRGRMKEVLKTSGGKMVAPVPIEESLKAVPMISQVCIVGDGRKHLAALITLSEWALAELKVRLRLPECGVIDHPEVPAEVQKHVDEVNRSLASYAQIKKFTVLAKDFSVETGEMTPTFKMKRAVIEKRYRDPIDQLYAQGGAGAAATSD